MMENTIQTEGLCKNYGDVQAVSDLSLNVRKGEIYGFLGLNGAGKTTTIRILLGLIRPTSGKAWLNGMRMESGSSRLLKNVGSLVEIPYSYPNLTVRENLEIIRRLRFLPDKKCIDQIIEELQLGNYAGVKAKNLSLGNAQRLGLAKALIHHPDILILDEPTNGLDPAGIHEIREMLESLARDLAVTIFISSHILGEISRFATRIGIIHNGNLIREINREELDLLCRKILVVNTRDNKEAISVLSGQGHEASQNREGLLELIDELSIANPENIAVMLVNAGFPPTSLKVEEEDLESYFLRTILEDGGAR